MPRLRAFDAADHLDDDEMIVLYLAACGRDSDRRVIIAGHAAAWRALRRRHSMSVARRKLRVLAGVARGQQVIADGRRLSTDQARLRLSRGMGGETVLGSRRGKATKRGGGEGG